MVRSIPQNKSNKLKIALAVHHFPPKYSAGAELRTFRTARWLVNYGYDVNIISVESVNYGTDNGIYWEEDIYKGLQVHRLFFNLANSEDRFIWEYDNPWIYNHLVEYLSKIEPDIFHLISGYILGGGAVKAALQHELPVVITLTDFWFFCPRINLIRPDGKLSNAYEFIARDCTRCNFEEKRRYLLPAQFLPKLVDLFWANSFDSKLSNLFKLGETETKFKVRNKTLLEILDNASAIICPSQYLLETLRSRGIQKKKIRLIQHGLDKSDWSPVVGRRSNGTFRIGYSGQINGHKGIHLLIKAFKRLRTNVSLELCIYGNVSSVPNYTNSLKKLAGGDPRIKFLGTYDYSEIAITLSHLDILVIPSIWNEIGPWVMYEAFEMKIPVLASNIPNMSHIIHHEKNGLLFECGNWKDLVVQLERVIEDEDLRMRLVDGIKPVNTIENEMAELVRVYREVVDEF
jgi:glycosyltransferase involved in cell wall biosynthesis